MRFFINNREMFFEKDKTKYLLPTLYNRDKMGRLNKWNIFVDGNSIQSNSQIDDGVIKTFKSVECKGKNIGRKNATTDEEQAIFECYSKWLKKKDQGYSEEIPQIQSVSKTNNLLPMLANKYSERGKKILGITFCSI